MEQIDAIEIKPENRTNESGSKLGTEVAPHKAVNLEKIKFVYRKSTEPALNQIELEIERGEMVAIMGPSGAGKSTLCQTLNGLIPHQIRGNLTGEIRIDNNDPVELGIAQMAPSIGLVFQDFEAQLFSTSVELEVAFAPENLKVPREEIKTRTLECLDRVNLTGLQKRQPATLSGGQKQRLAIASVLAVRPNVLCLDEPTTDLDPIGKREVFDIARDLVEHEYTLVIVEHETRECYLATRIVLLDQGQIVRDGPKDEVLREVELFKELRIQPLEIPELFAAIGYKTADRPLTPSEGLEHYRSKEVAVKSNSGDLLHSIDEQRKLKYGRIILEADSVSYNYDNGFRAVNNVNLAVRQGEFIALLGQNGSGKTTFAKQLNGLLRPTRGQIFIDGESISDKSLLEIGADIGYVFQNPDHQIFCNTVLEEVSFSLAKQKIAEDEIGSMVEEALSEVGLAGKEDHDPFSMSKGERQRVAVATALVTKPKILILDEPTTGLDYSQQIGMMNLVRNLNDNGTTVIMITHAMSIVCQYAHRTIVMKNGSITRDSTTREVFAHDVELESESLSPPDIVKLTNRLGVTALTVEEALLISDYSGEPR